MTDAPLPPWTRYDTYDDRSWFIGHTPNMVDIRLGRFIMSTYWTMTTTNSTKSTKIEVTSVPIFHPQKMLYLDRVWSSIGL